MHVMDVPLLAERLGCVMFMRNFEGNVTQIRGLLGMMDSAASALRDSAAFKALLQTILAVGNQMNSGTTKGAAEVRCCGPLLRTPAGAPRSGGRVCDRACLTRRLVVCRASSCRCC